MKTSMDLTPIPREEFNYINIFAFLDLDIDDALMAYFDDVFVRQLRKPDAFRRYHGKEKVSTYYILDGDEEVNIDYRVYLTWSNTFHLRFAHLLKRMNQHYRNPFIHPDVQIAVARLLAFGEKPLPVAQLEYCFCNGSIVHPDYEPTLTRRQA